MKPPLRDGCGGAGGGPESDREMGLCIVEGTRHDSSHSNSRERHSA